ncbi:unnamed protein product [Discula destructiva]
MAPKKEKEISIMMMMMMMIGGYRLDLVASWNS